MVIASRASLRYAKKYPGTPKWAGSLRILDEGNKEIERRASLALLGGIGVAALVSWWIVPNWLEPRKRWGTGTSES